jgi:branched-chain amino acid transport system substrate-binding protein
LAVQDEAKDRPVTEPPEVPDRATTQKEGGRVPRPFPVGLLAIVVIVSTAVVSYGLVRIFSGKGTTPAFESVGNGKIAFVAEGEGPGLSQPVNLDIFVMNPDGTEVTNITNNAAQDENPAWSPDGTRIAFASDRAQSPNSWPTHVDIYVMNADGTGVTRLTDGSGSNNYPAWSPDGERIAFSGTDGPSDDNYIFVMNADGTTVTRLTDRPASDAGPTWSPDGSRIAFASERDGNWDIHVMGVDGGGLTNLTRDLTRNPTPDLSPAWSPDGTTILFRSQRDHSGGSIHEGAWPDELYLMRVDGSDTTRLTNDLRLEQHPSWAPGGSRIVFDDGGVAIYVMSPDGTSVSLNVAGYDPAWQPLPGRRVPTEPAFTLLPGTTPGRASGQEPPSCPDTEFGCVAIRPGGPIEIGTLLSITGPSASLGADARNGARLAANFLKPPGEVLGHPIVWVDKDDSCTVKARYGAHDLSLDADTAAVIGTTCSITALGRSDTILSEFGIVLISPSNTEPALTDPATHQPYYLRTAHNDKLQAAAVANFAFKEAGWKTASTIHDGSPYSDGLQQVFADTFTSLGGTIAKQEAVQVGATSVTPLLSDMAADNLDGLYFPILPAEGALISGQVRSIPGLRSTELAGSDALLTPEFIKAAGKRNTEGMYISGPDFTAFQGTHVYRAEFLPAYERKFGEEPRSAHAAYGFDAATLVFQAIEEVAIETSDGGLLIPRTGLRDQLFATTDFPGISGNLACNQNGDCQPQASFAIFRIHDGDFGSPMFRSSVRLSP